MSIGERLRELRKAKGWSQLDASMEFDMDVSGVARIEKGLRKPMYRTLIRACEIYGLSLEELFKGVKY